MRSIKAFLVAALVTAFAAALCACGTQNAKTAGTNDKTQAEITAEIESTQKKDTDGTAKSDALWLIYKKTQRDTYGTTTTTYDYDGAGNVVSELMLSGTSQTKRDYTYDESGNRISFHEKSPDGEYTEIAEYNENGKPIKTYNLETPDVFVTIEYNEDGTQAKRSCYRNGALFYEISYSYNEDGTISLVSEGEQFGKEEALFSKTNKPLRSSSNGITIEYEYDEHDNETKIIQTVQNGSVTVIEFSYEYDDEGKIVKTTRSSADGETYTTVSEYGDQGELLHTITTDSLGAKTQEVDYEYRFFPKG